MSAGTIEFYFSWVIQLMLIMVRISTLFLVNPLLSRVNVPALAKIGLSLLTAFILINAHPPGPDYPYNDLWPLAAAVVREMTVGVVMGVVTLFYFNIIYTAGHIMDMQIGFSMAQVFDVSVGGQVAVTAGLLNVVVMLSFILNDGIAYTLQIMSSSFSHIPVGTGVLHPATVTMAVDLFAKCFILSIQVAMPVLGSALLTEVALGVIVRTAPQMNVFVVGIPIKIIVGLIILLAMISTFTTFTTHLFEEMYDSIDELLGGMTP